MRKPEIPFLIASSVTANFPGEKRFSLAETIRIAAKNEADGVQLYINPKVFIDGIEGRSQIRQMLDYNHLAINVAHLPGYTVPKDLDDEATYAAMIASDILDPIPNVGKVCVIHHRPYSGISKEEIATAIQNLEHNVRDRQITIGLEHYHPPKETNQGNLPVQVNDYLTLLLYLQGYFPTIAVFDIGRFHTINANNNGIPLTDPDNQLLEQMCKSVAGQHVLIHAADFKDPLQRAVVPGNAIRIGTKDGVMTPIHKKTAELGEKYGIKWVGVVDETEDATQISNRQKVIALFST